MALAAGATACSTGTSPVAPATAVEVAPPSSPPSLVPQRCANDQGDCLPPVAWVEKLCQGVHPEVALHMFRGGSPWTRLYARANAPAYNGTGGPSLLDEHVSTNEELIALRRHADSRSVGAAEMSIGATAGYDLLRWNGSCVTLHDGEFDPEPPAARRHAKVEWRWLGDETRQALRRSGSVRGAYLARRKECRGATFGSVTQACVEYDEQLVTAIVDYVRTGAPLPEPSETL